MKELKIFILVLAIGLSGASPATPKFTISHYPNTVKGGLQTPQKEQSAKAVAVNVEGKYEYYLQFLKFKLDYQNNPGEQEGKKALKFSSCVLNDTLKVSC